jgi:hypothetical protein
MTIPFPKAEASRLRADLATVRAVDSGVADDFARLLDDAEAAEEVEEDTYLAIAERVAAVLAPKKLDPTVARVLLDLSRITPSVRAIYDRHSLYDGISKVADPNDTTGANAPLVDDILYSLRLHEAQSQFDNGVAALIRHLRAQPRLSEHHLRSIIRVFLSKPRAVAEVDELERDFGSDDVIMRMTTRAKAEGVHEVQGDKALVDLVTQRRHLWAGSGITQLRSILRAALDRGLDPDSRKRLQVELGDDTAIANMLRG